MPWKPNHEEASVSLSIESSSGEKVLLNSGGIAPGTYTVYGKTEVLTEQDLPEDAYIAILFVHALIDERGEIVGDIKSKDVGVIVEDEKVFPITEITVPDIKGTLEWSAHAHAGTSERNNTSFGDWDVRSLRIIRD